ncbi:hypothetical protein [Stenoxybacter acetivorans]|uniref:hypothetical protein n=1 Tax=Stenoxybacter acetivorans TaxID=422441 RepID=UPI0012EB6821|nr:hypothetical protein [Stenoxybacter acetivorans]
MNRKNIIRILACLLLFFIGMWVFNHFTYPLAGVLVALALPFYYLLTSLKG